MGEFEQWFKSLNENGRVTYFLGQEGKVAKEAWDFQQSKIEQLEKRIAKTLDMLEGDLSYVEEDRRRNFDFLQMAMIRCLKYDIKTLRGDSCG